MSKIFQLEGGQYEHPNEYKLVSTTRGTTILQPEFGTVIIEGDVIEASTHNTIQKNGVLASKVNVTMESTDTVLVPTDMTIESDLFNELKIMLLFKTGTTLPSNSFIKLKDTNIPIANVNDYVVNANTPLLFLYFDSKFYAYKAGEGASTGATESIAGTIKISTTGQVSAGTDNTTAVSPAKLKEIFVNGSRKTQNGYQKLPSGVIMQWGMFADNVANVTFPVAFPTGCASLQITIGVETASGELWLPLPVVLELSNTSFTVNPVRSPPYKLRVYWFAVGY